MATNRSSTRRLLRLHPHPHYRHHHDRYDHPGGFGHDLGHDLHLVVPYLQDEEEDDPAEVVMASSPGANNVKARVRQDAASSGAALEVQSAKEEPFAADLHQEVVAGDDEHYRAAF